MAVQMEGEFSITKNFVKFYMPFEPTDDDVNGHNIVEHGFETEDGPASESTFGVHVDTFEDKVNTLLPSITM